MVSVSVSNLGKDSFPVLVPFLAPVPALVLAPVPDPDNSLSPNQKFVQCLAFPMFEAVLLAAHFDSLTFGFLPMLDPVLALVRAPVSDQDNSFSTTHKFVQYLAFPMFESVLLASHFDSLTFVFHLMLDPVLVPLRPLSVV